MTDATSSNPHKEVDEGRLAAANGQGLARNPYPRGTIRHEEWRRGWQIKRDEVLGLGHEGCVAAAAGQSLSANPYPRGTIRYDDWRRGWRLKRDEMERAERTPETRDGCNDLAHPAPPKVS